MGNFSHGERVGGFLAPPPLMKIFKIVQHFTMFFLNFHKIKCKWWLVRKSIFHSYEGMGVEYKNHEECKRLHPHRNLNLLYSHAVSSMLIQIGPNTITILMPTHSFLRSKEFLFKPILTIALNILTILSCQHTS